MKNLLDGLRALHIMRYIKRMTRKTKTSNKEYNDENGYPTLPTLIYAR